MAPLSPTAMQLFVSTQKIAFSVLPWGSGFCQTQGLDPTRTAACADGLFTVTPIRVIRMGARWNDVFSRFMTNVSFSPDEAQVHVRRPARGAPQTKSSDRGTQPKWSPSGPPPGSGLGTLIVYTTGNACIPVRFRLTGARRSPSLSAS